MKKLYVKCTTDKYELPIAVADSPGELANMLWVWRTVSFYFEIKEFHHLGRDLTDDLSSGFHHLNLTETAPKVTDGL